MSFEFIDIFEDEDVGKDGNDEYEVFLSKFIFLCVSIILLAFEKSLGTKRGLKISFIFLFDFDISLLIKIFFLFGDIFIFGFKFSVFLIGLKFLFFPNKILLLLFLIF